MTPIEIPVEIRRRIYAHAIAVYPAECCGYLTGPVGDDRVDTVVACRNAQLDGEHPITPSRGADTGFVIAGAELFAFYHSHTNGRAYFSDVDRAMATGPTYPVQHLVVGVLEGGITEAAQFAWSETERDHVEIARWTP
jgi:proteasome lid subunit RPN8/RPN11